MYQFYFFDLDGTITDSSLGITNSVRYALAKYGIEEPDRKKLYRFIGPPLASRSGSFMGSLKSSARKRSGTTGNITGIRESMRTRCMTAWKRC